LFKLSVGPLRICKNFQTVTCSRAYKVAVVIILKCLTKTVCLGLEITLSVTLFG